MNFNKNELYEIIILFIFTSRETTKPDVHAGDRSSYFGSLSFRALAAKPEFVTISYDCKKAGSDIFVSVKVSKELHNICLMCYKFILYLKLNSYHRKQ